MTENKSPDVSIVIPSFNRTEYLRNTIKCLKDQTYINFEIIIVDQTPDAPLKDFCSKFSKIRYISIEEANLTKALNIGWQEACGEIIVFLDDDIAIDDSSFLYHHIENYVDEAIGAVAGSIYKPDQQSSSTLSSKFNQSSLKWLYFRYDTEKRVEIDALPGANFSMRKNILENIGGIDEHFIQNAFHWELDLASRIRKVGYKIIFDPKARIVHLYNSPGGAQNQNRISTQEESHEYFVYFLHNCTYCFAKNEKRFFVYLVYRLFRQYLLNRTHLQLGFHFFLHRFSAMIKGFCWGLSRYTQALWARAL